MCFFFFFFLLTPKTRLLRVSVEYVLSALGRVLVRLLPLARASPHTQPPSLAALSHQYFIRRSSPCPGPFSSLLAHRPRFCH